MQVWTHNPNTNTWYRDGEVFILEIKMDDDGCLATAYAQQNQFAWHDEPLPIPVLIRRFANKAVAMDWLNAVDAKADAKARIGNALQHDG